MPVLTASSSCLTSCFGRRTWRTWRLRGRTWADRSSVSSLENRGLLQMKMSLGLEVSTYRYTKLPDAVSGCLGPDIFQNRIRLTVRLIGKCVCVCVCGGGGGGGGM